MQWGGGPIFDPTLSFARLTRVLGLDPSQHALRTIWSHFRRKRPHCQRKLAQCCCQRYRFASCVREVLDLYMQRVRRVQVRKPRAEDGTSAKPS